jgi:hypothetical protein
LSKISSRKSSIVMSLKWCALCSTEISPLSEIPTCGTQSHVTYSTESRNVFFKKATRQ